MIRQTHSTLPILWAFMLVVGVAGTSEAGSSYYPRCATVLPQQLQARFFKGWEFEETANCETCSTICAFKNKKQRSTASIVYTCSEDGSKEPPDKLPAGASLVSGLGRQALRKLEDKTTQLVEVWDDDSPCDLVFRWKGTDARKKVLDLARAATQATTREIITRPVFDAIIWNETDSPSVAKKWVDTWASEAALLGRLVRLAPGYPQVVEGKAVPGLEEGQTLVLGYCPAPKGAELVTLLEATNKEVYSLRVELPAEAASCPQVLNQANLEEERILKKSGRELAVGLYSFVPDGGTPSRPVTQLIASLRDASGNLLDSRLLSAFTPEEPMDPPCETKLEQLERGWRARTRCPVGTVCEHPGETLHTHTFLLSADGGLQIDAGVQQGRADCSPGD
ncbi:hypothetical protein [Hyalangium versicolor]|uniref:hypothetical protein n=1 Tax=Hyalangium versicolor TaxID=2861190 RepID=UPI001CCF15BA|nr:hypothetical protein [Hyalangium versicolor]